jgi:hypothetical protein
MLKTDSLLAPILKNLCIEEDVRLARIRNNWETIFEKPLSLHMSPVRLTEGELLLYVDSPIWLQQLSYYKREMLNKLYRYGVKELRLSLGRISSKKPAEQRIREQKVLSPEDHRFISEVVLPLDDPDLKKAIRNALERSLQSSKHLR